MIELKNVCKAFGSKRVLDHVSLRFEEGQTLFVLGKSGVGKSVLLKHIVGLMEPDSGEVWVNGINVTAANELQLAQVRRQCGMVFQYPALLDSLTIYENLVFGLRSHSIGKTEEDRETIAIKRLSQVGLKADLLSRYPPELSFSVQKRIAIARALALEPSYLLFDEPTTGMDPIVTESLGRLIAHLSQDLGVTCVVVSHDLESAFKVADRIILLDQGKVVVDGPKETMCESKSELAQAFVKEGYFR